MHQSSWDKMMAFRLKYLSGREKEKLTIFDLGSQDVNGSYKKIFSEPAWTYTGLDMEPGSNVDIVMKNPYAWKEIASKSVDLLVSGQAFEHIRFFWITMLEIERVLKPGGICCIIAPSAGHEHRYPVDCWRFYPDGFRAVAEFSGLVVVDVFTQWTDDPRYAEDSNEWRDSVLVCKKSAQGSAGGMKRKISDFLMRRLLLSRLNIK